MDTSFLGFVYQEPLAKLIAPFDVRSQLEGLRFETSVSCFSQDTDRTSCRDLQVEGVDEARPGSGDYYVGVTETTPFETDFIQRHSIARPNPEDLSVSIQPAVDWVPASGKKRIAVHYDLDPKRHDFLLFSNPDAGPGAIDGVAIARMAMEGVQAILSAVSNEAEILGLAIIEYLPWSAIKLAGVLLTCRCCSFLSPAPTRLQPYQCEQNRNIVFLASPADGIFPRIESEVSHVQHSHEARTRR